MYLTWNFLTVIRMKGKNLVRNFLIIVIALFSFVIAVTSILSYMNPGSHYHEHNWFVYIGMGALAFFALLLHTTTLERPRDFARLHIYEFFALSVLVTSLVLTVVLFPVEIFPDNMAVKKINKFEEVAQPNATQWVIAVGDITEKGEGIGLQIPIYIIVAGISGAYLRYLYGYIRGKEVEEDEEILLELKKWYLKQKKIVNTLCIAAGLEYHKIRKGEGTEVVRLKHMHKIYDIRRDFIFFLPPHSTAKLADYLAGHFNRLYEVEENYETRIFELRISTYRRTIRAIGAFFLAPLLAVMAWLLLDLSSETQSWQAFAVVGFAAGLSTEAIIERIWSFMGERFPPKKEEASDKQKSVSDELTKLSKLKEEGTISEKEFSKMKQKLIKKM